MKYSVKNPSGKLYTNNIRFLLARPTDDYKLAHYIVLTKDVEAKRDLKHYANNHQNRQQPHRFGSMDEIIPIMRHHLPASQLRKRINACPKVPTRANGKSCLTRNAQNLPDSMWLELERASKPYDSVNPPLLASTIELETRFDPLLENEAERLICQKNPKNCPQYRWGRGLGQFGLTEELQLGLTWENSKLEKLLKKKLKHCRKGPYTFKLSDKCVGLLLQICSHHKGGKKSVFCPRPAIKATAKKLHLTLPKRQIIWEQNKSELQPIDLIPLLEQSPNFKLRFRTGTYNRGARTITSWENHVNIYGRSPTNYGELWAAPRLDGKTPSPSIGYSILRGEYINRCYVWRMAGLCGPIPATSVISQYRLQYRKWLKRRSLASK